MQQRFLGKTGLSVSELALGALNFGRYTDAPASHLILDSFVDAGGTFIDTADVYGYGRSEEIIGSWLKGRDRDGLVIATKAYGESADGAPPNGAGRKHIMRAVEDSLRRLGTDYIDLYQIHVFDDATPFEETLSTLDRLVGSGKVRFIGASNYTGWQFQKSIDLSRQHGWEPFVSLQPLYNLLDRTAEHELIPVALNEGAGVIPWSPLHGGWLSGSYRRDMTGPPPGSRASAEAWAAAYAENDDDLTWRVLDALFAIAEELERTPAQVALRWLLQRPGVTAPIIGPRTPEHLADNLGATGWTLADTQLDRLTDASARKRPYPYELQALPQFVRRPT